MSSADTTIEQFLSFKPWQYSYVERFELYPDFGDEDELSLNDLVIKVELLSNAYEGDLQIIFRGVRNVQLNIEGSGFQIMGGLSITPFRESQWEGVRYHVGEQEGNHLSFLCQRFEASLKQEENQTENS